MKLTVLLIWLLTGAGIFVFPSALWARDVKDPVCRMTVDSDLTPYTFMLGDRTYYFCSPSCQERFEKEPARYADLSSQLEREPARDYVVDLQVDSHPLSGKPIRMTFAVRYADTKQLVRNFEVVHEKLLHLVMVSSDLSWFQHQHPQLEKDGIFHLTWTFPRPGEYWLYSDFTPSDGNNQIKRSIIKVFPGSPRETPYAARDIPVGPDATLKKRTGNYLISLNLQPATLSAGRPSLLNYVVTDTHGRVVRDIQPWLGAMGHLFAISANGRDVVHTHALQPVPVQPTMSHNTGEALSQPVPLGRASGGGASGGDTGLTFKLEVPTAGIYKVWAQFRVQNHLLTVPFTLRAEADR